jgi:uncharacterized protein YbaR (Trm112 family)
MDEMTAIDQPVEYLESLLETLACPLDNSVPLTAVRNAAGEVVALRSRDAEYPASFQITEIEALHFLSRVPAKMNAENRFLVISRHFCTFPEAGASKKCKPISRHFQVK